MEKRREDREKGHVCPQTACVLEREYSDLSSISCIQLSNDSFNIVAQSLPVRSITSSTSNIRGRFNNLST